MKKIIAALFALIASAAFGTTTVPVQLLNPTGSTSGQVVVSTGASSPPAWGGIGISAIAPIAANTVISNFTSSSAAPTAFSMPSCSTSSSALQYTTSTGITCGTVAMSGANSNITSLTGLTTPLSAIQGGTGISSITQYNVVVGASGALGFVGPSTSGLVLTSNGTSAYPSFLAIPWSTPPAIGNTTAAAGSFTTLSASSTVSGTGFSTYLATPPAIGGTTAAAGSFTTLSASSAVSGSGFSTYLASPPAIGGTAASSGAFTTLSASGAVSGTGFSNYLASPPAIGGTAAAAGSFTTLSASSTVSGTGFSTYLASPPAIGGTTPGNVTIKGVTTGSCAGSGNVGQCLSVNVPNGSAVSLTTATAANVTSLSLTAGNWLISGNVCFAPGTGASSSFNMAWLSTTTAAVPTSPNAGAETIQNAAIVQSNGTFCLPTGLTFQTVTTTTTMFMSALSTFSGGTMTAYGYLFAIRFN